MTTTNAPLIYIAAACFGIIRAISRKPLQQVLNIIKV
jgi:hypothetical protein